MSSERKISVNIIIKKHTDSMFENPDIGESGFHNPKSRFRMKSRFWNSILIIIWIIKHKHSHVPKTNTSIPGSTLSFSLVAT